MDSRGYDASSHRVSFTEKIFYLAGLISGDGHLEGGRNRIDIRIADECFAKNIANEFAYFQPCLDLGHKRVRITSKELVWNLENYFELPKGNKSRIIRIPEIVLSATESECAAYLAGWFDAEGSLSLSKRTKIGPYPSISFCVCNEEVCFRIGKLLT